MSWGYSKCNVNPYIYLAYGPFGCYLLKFPDNKLFRLQTLNQATRNGSRGRHPGLPKTALTFTLQTQRRVVLAVMNPQDSSNQCCHCELGGHGQIRWEQTIWKKAKKGWQDLRFNQEAPAENVRAALAAAKSPSCCRSSSADPCSDAALAAAAPRLSLEQSLCSSSLKYLKGGRVWKKAREALLILPRLGSHAFHRLPSLHQLSVQHQLLFYSHRPPW